jgi:hypothetical protein
LGGKTLSKFYEIKMIKFAQKVFGRNGDTLN